MTDAELDAIEADLATHYSYRACKRIAERLIKELRVERQAYNAKPSPRPAASPGKRAEGE